MLVVGIRSKGVSLGEYELSLVLEPELDEEGLNAATQKVAAFIAGHGGEVLSLEVRGRRRLAYPIRKKRDGTDTLVRLKMGAESVKELDRQLKLTEQVLRHMLIRTD